MAAMLLFAGNRRTVCLLLIASYFANFACINAESSDGRLGRPSLDDPAETVTVKPATKEEPPPKTKSEETTTTNTG
ncbi:hypothetical protein ACKKBF_B39625 [Auxenochlorella protothecoides x Auxenochlorella symbiontica]